ncbi:unnamed protein product [Toxocara canis]|uniref:Insulin-degrading enzyme n=1 Tax=Toxocara canis TaxID=6265 RepID=A0A3P7GQT6_TOXCA|nr:unnamed protein product [Toxocara canis]
MENFVVSLNFGSIAEKNVSRRVWDEGPYDREQLGVKIELVPVKDLRYLTLLFPMKDYKEEYRSQPTHYVSHLIGHEGPGSLLSELKRLGWVSSLSAGGRLLANGFGVFNVSVDLSEEGLKHTENIIKLIFNEIGLVRSKGPLKWVHDELRQLAETKFRFKDKEVPINYVTHLSSELQRIPFEDVVCADYKMDQFKPELITELLEALTPENMMYAVVSQQFANQEGNIREKWYQTEYRKSRIDEAFLSECRSALNNIPSCLRIPEKNEYIATKFDLKQREATVSVAPRLIRDDSWARVWFMQDNEFNLPKCSTKVAIHAPVMASDPMNTFLSAMYVICLQDALAEETYNPFLAGLSSAFDIQPWGISLRVSGYDEKQQLFTRHLVRRLVNFTPDEGRYEVLKENLCRNLRNFRQTQPYLQTHYYTGMLLGSRQWSKEQVLACAEACDVERLRKFIRESLQAIHVEALVYGNSTEDETLKMVEEITAELKTVPNVRPLFTCEVHQNREHEIPQGRAFVYKGFQSTHANASINLVMQTGLQSTRDNVLLELIVQLAAEPAFNQLRTNEQLGYIVHTGARRSHGTQGLEMLVQGQQDPEYMEERIEHFLKTFRANLESMSEEEFKDNVEALAAKRLEKPKTMGAKASRFWAEIDVGFYHFNREETEVPVLRELTKHEVMEFFDRHFSEDSPMRRKLCTMIYANDVSEDKVMARGRVKRSAAGDATEACEIIENIDAFKSSLSLYPLPQPVIDIPPLASKNDLKVYS